VLYRKKKKSTFPFGNGFAKSRETDEQLRPMLRLIGFIDNDPLVNPQILRSNLMYTLKFKIKGIIWMDHAEKLCINFVSTCPSSEYSLSKFELSKPENIENIWHNLISKLNFKPTGQRIDIYYECADCKIKES